MSVKFWERVTKGLPQRDVRRLDFCYDLETRIDSDAVPSDLRGLVAELRYFRSCFVSDKIRADRFAEFLLSLNGFDRKRKWQPVAWKQV